MKTLTDTQIKTLRSLEDIHGDGSFFGMTYWADYRLDEVLTSGADTWESFQEAVHRLLVNGEMPALSEGDGCTVFTVRSPDGHVLVGRNFDFRHKKSDRGTGRLILKTNPVRDYQSFGMVDMTFAGMSGRLQSLAAGNAADISAGDPAALDADNPTALMMTPYVLMDGMNEKGVFIAILALAYPGVRQNTGKPKTLPTLAMRTVLDRASSVAEAVTLFSNFDMQISTPHKTFQFFVADRKGHSAVIEYDDSRMVVVDSPLATNFYLAEGISRKAEGKARYGIARALMDYRGNIMDKNDVMASLRLLSQPAGGHENSDTLWSAVYDLTTGEADIVTGHRYDRPVHIGFSF